MVEAYNTNKNKAFIDIRLRPYRNAAFHAHCGQTWRHP